VRGSTAEPRRLVLTTNRAASTHARAKTRDAATEFVSAPLADEAALRRSTGDGPGALSSAVVSDGEIPVAVADDPDDHQGGGHR